MLNYSYKYRDCTFKITLYVILIVKMVDYTIPEHTGVIFNQTCIMSAVFNDGIVIGADSRTTMGQYVASRVTDKIENIHHNIFA
jgi:20S proteasome alpha/beta subunit